MRRGVLARFSAVVAAARRHGRRRGRHSLSRALTQAGVPAPCGKRPEKGWGVRLLWLQGGAPGGEDGWHGDVTSVEDSGWFKGGGCADGGVAGGCVGRQRRGEQGRGTPLCLAYA